MTMPQMRLLATALGLMIMASVLGSVVAQESFNLPPVLREFRRQNTGSNATGSIWKTGVFQRWVTHCAATCINLVPLLHDDISRAACSKFRFYASSQRDSQAFL